MTPTPELRIGSLCSGMGGLDMGVQLALGGTVAWHVEYDKDPSAILAHHWRHIPNHGDVKTTDWSQVEPVEVLTAGYPCQPFSHAGKRKGSSDERHLWPYVAGAIGCLRPRLVVLENVRGHVSLGLDAVIGDLSGLGYDARWGVVRAADAGAPHGRARIFIVASPHAASNRWDEGRTEPAWVVGGPDAAELVGLAAADTGASVSAADARGERHGRGEDGRSLGRVDREDADGPRERERSRQVAVDRGAAGRGCRSRATVNRSIEWGDYEPAIRRWERLTRPAPAPTEPGAKGQPRLSPRFVEWLMGLPAGHVTDVPISRNAQLKALGNGVVPQQAALALRWLLGAAEPMAPTSPSLLPTPTAQLQHDSQTHRSGKRSGELLLGGVALSLAKGESA